MQRAKDLLRDAKFLPPEAAPPDDAQVHLASDWESYAWHVNTCPSCTTGGTYPVLDSRK